jgi:hypothetical protein
MNLNVKKMKEMKEQLIEFKTAILAKEKGLPQNIHYFSDYDSRPPYYGINNELCKGDEKRFGTCRTISQSLLQQWLRENYNYHFICEIGIENEDLKNPYFKYRMHNPEIGSSTIGGVTDTYEEALEKGLIEALKLIK